MMRIAIWMLLPLFLAGCVVATSERQGLPTGVTLLDSADGSCDGPIEVDADPDIVIDPGESTTVALDDEDDADVEWECLAGASAEPEELECPAGTSYVRVTREEDEADFSLECYGS